MKTPRDKSVLNATGKVVLRDAGKTVTWTVRRGDEKKSDYMPQAGSTRSK